MAAITCGAQPYVKFSSADERQLVHYSSLVSPDCVRVCARSWSRYRPMFGGVREMRMSHYSPQLVQTMRDALETAMTKVPLDRATPGVKAHLAEIILLAAAGGLTSFEGLVAVASAQIQTIISTLT